MVHRPCGCTREDGAGVAISRSTAVTCLENSLRTPHMSSSRFLSLLATSIHFRIFVEEGYSCLLLLCSSFSVMLSDSLFPGSCRSMRNVGDNFPFSILSRRGKFSTTLRLSEDLLTARKTLAGWDSSALYQAEKCAVRELQLRETASETIRANTF